MDRIAHVAAVVAERVQVYELMNKEKNRKGFKEEGLKLMSVRREGRKNETWANVWNLVGASQSPNPLTRFGAL